MAKNKRKSRKYNQRGFVSLPFISKKRTARNKSGKFKSKNFKVFGRRISRLRAYALAALLVFAGVGVYLTFFSTAATYPQKGINPGMNWTSPVAQHASNAHYISLSGAQWTRVQVLWNEIEKTHGNYYWAGLDSQVSELRKRGIGVILVNDTVPCFASTQPGVTCGVLNGQPSTPNYGNHNIHWKPDNTKHALFMRALAARYSAAPFGVHTYEVWNEQNKSAFWPSAGPDSNIGQRAREYVDLLKPTYDYIRAGDPNATVLFGGMTSSDVVFLREAYRLGAGSKIHGIATHLFPPKPPAGQDPVKYCPRDKKKNPTNSNTICSIELLHAVDRSKKIWITEISWSTCTGGDSRCVNSSQQAAYIDQAYKYITATYPTFVKATIWYQLLDGYDTAPWGNGQGVLDANYGAKPSWAYYANVPKGSPLTSLENPPYYVPPPPDTTKPTVYINAPSNGATVKGAYQELQATVNDNNIAGGVYVEFKLDGVKISDKIYAKNYGGLYTSSIIWDSTKVADGSHVLSAVATDAAGNFTESAAITIKVDNYTTATPPPPPPGSNDCSDGIDNDNDGPVDWAGDGGDNTPLEMQYGSDPECDSATDSEW